MFQWIKNRSSRRQRAHDIYGSIVAQARHPAFYRNFSVADDVSGRFEMICLHMFATLDRLGAADASEDLGRELIERFFTDMDDVMREMGVGDTTVPKKMRRTSEALYGRLKAYGEGVRSNDTADLPRALGRNVYGHDGEDIETNIRCQALAGYLRATLAYLDTQTDAEFFGAGRIRFPDPD